MQVKQAPYELSSDTSYRVASSNLILKNIDHAIRALYFTCITHQDT